MCWAVSSQCILAVSSLSNSTDRHARLDAFDTPNESCRVETWRDEPSGIWALVSHKQYYFHIPRKSYRCNTICQHVTGKLLQYVSRTIIHARISEQWIQYLSYWSCYLPFVHTSCFIYNHLLINHSHQFQLHQFQILLNEWLSRDQSLHRSAARLQWSKSCANKLCRDNSGGSHL